MNATTKADNEYRAKVRQEIAQQTAYYQNLEVVITRFEKSNSYLSNVLMHPEQWYDHELAIEFAKFWVFECAQAIADYSV